MIIIDFRTLCRNFFSRISLSYRILIREIVRQERFGLTKLREIFECEFIDVVRFGVWYDIRFSLDRLSVFHLSSH